MSVTQADAHSDHGHDHPPFLAHHWDTPEQQFEAGKTGMWLFLATEVLLFGGLFCGYAVWRGNHPELFQFGSTFLDTTMGAINTGVLILSSLTMAWGVTAAQQNKQGLLKIMLILTFLGACGFLVIKYFEYTHKFHEGWYPGMAFYEWPTGLSHTWEDGYAAIDLSVQPEAPELSTTAPEPPGAPTVEPTTVLPAESGPAGLAADAAALIDDGHGIDQPDQEFPEREADHHAGEHQKHPLQNPDRPANAHMFFNIYFMMTGLHAIHVVIGMIVIAWLFWGAMRGRFNDEYFTPVDLGGLYWHVVDLIWIFLFPLFYLI